MIVVLLVLIVFAILFPGVLRFLILSVLALLGVLFLMEVGKAQEVQGLKLPQYPIDQICSAYSKGNSQSATYCINIEQSAYDHLKFGGMSNGVEFSWVDLPFKDQNECSNRLTNQMTDKNINLAFPYTSLQACVISRMTVYRMRNPLPVPEFQH